MHQVGRDTVAIGFGCFWFGVTADAPESFTGSDYLDEIQAALGQVSAIEDVEVEVGSAFREATFSRPDTHHHIAGGVGLFPPMQFGELRFRLVIPQRVQRDITGVGSASTERFQVTITPAYRVAAAMVECLDSPQEDDPSGAVQIVRELLMIELGRLSSPWVEFQFLGPSPAHVDVHLHANTSTASGDEEFTLMTSTQPAYRRLSYSYDLGAYPSATEAAAGFFAAVHSELDLLYLAKQIYLVSAEQWSQIQGLVASTVKAQRSTGVKAFAARTFGARQMDNARIALAEFELDYLGLSALLRSDANTTYAAGTTTYLGDYVNPDLDDLREFPVSQVGELLGILEHRRLTDRELFIVAIASTLGGVAGAVGALLAGG